MVLKKANFILGAVLLLVIGVSTTLGYVPAPQLCLTRVTILIIRRRGQSLAPPEES